MSVMESSVAHYLSRVTAHLARQSSVVTKSTSSRSTMQLMLPNTLRSRLVRCCANLCRAYEREREREKKKKKKKNRKKREKVRNDV